MPIYANIAGAQKEVNDWYCNINGVSKKFNSFLGNVDGTAVELLPTSVYWKLPSSGNGTLASNTRTRMVSDSVTVSSDGTFTLLNATSISGIPAQGKFFVSISTSSNSSATTGSTLYYATNGSGAYRAFNIRNGIILSSSSFPSEVRSNSPDVFYELNGSQHNLYISKDLIPSLYRWTQYNRTHGGYTSERVNYSIDLSTPSSTTSIKASADVPPVHSFGYFIFSTTILAQDAVGYYVQSYGSSSPQNAYHIESTGWSDGEYKLYSDYRYRIVTVYKRGSATGNYAFSTNSSAYPTDGEYGDYWYYNRTTIT